MKDWFSWNGERCTEYGVYVREQPAIIRPSERVSTVTVPGRSGALTLPEGEDVYDDIVLACDCVMRDPLTPLRGSIESRIAQFNGWLRGSGRVSFACRPNGWYEGRVSNQISFEKILRGNPHVSFSVQFRCAPCFYLYDGLNRCVMTGSEMTLRNRGNTAANPLITVTGAGSGSISVVGRNVQTLYLNDLAAGESIVLDCDARVAYVQGEGGIELSGAQLSGDWLTFPTGQFSVLTEGDITGVAITPRWRCI